MKNGDLKTNLIQDNAQKEILCTEAFKNLDNVTDGLGLEIDPEIKELVVALNLNGIPTLSSCAGHTDTENIRPPYIQGQADGAPEFRYDGEEEIVKKLMNKYHFTRWRDVFGDDNARPEYYNLTRDLNESEEYKIWDAGNKPLEKKITDILNEFNKGITRSEIQLKSVPIYPGYRVEACLVGEDSPKDFDKESAEQNKNFVITAQNIFMQFKDFLRSKYFN